MVGMLLTTMQRWQDEQIPVLIVATCNDVTKLPTEFQRRFTRFFWLDTPTEAERQEIARIHLAKLQCTEALAEQVARMTADFTGAEIENVILSAARRTRRQLTAEALEAAAREVNPISRRKNIEELRKVAAEMTRANSDEAPTEAPTGRRIARKQAQDVE
jgi:SpoVK/Ycf46/Vps4 family AAA+-type ATPase